MKIKIKKIRADAITPSRAKDSDAGYDLYAAEGCILQPMQRLMIPTGIAVEIPKGYYGRVAPRSGMSIKSGIDVLAGVIDSGYRSELGVVLINLNLPEELFMHKAKALPAFCSLFGSAHNFRIKAGDRIAQIIIEKCYDVSWSVTEELSDSERGFGGFGSSGK